MCIVAGVAVLLVHYSDTLMHFDYAKAAQPIWQHLSQTRWRKLIHQIQQRIRLRHERYLKLALLPIVGLQTGFEWQSVEFIYFAGQKLGVFQWGFLCWDWPNPLFSKDFFTIKSSNEFLSPTNRGVGMIRSMSFRGVSNKPAEDHVRIENLTKKTCRPTKTAFQVNGCLIPGVRYVNWLKVKAGRK